MRILKISYGMGRAAFGTFSLTSGALSLASAALSLVSGTLSLALVTGVGLALAPIDSQAQNNKAKPKAAAPITASAAASSSSPATSSQINLPGAPSISLAARSWLLVDVTSGQTLAAYEPDLKVEPASLTKLMTAYLTFAAIKEKKLTLDARPAVTPMAYKAEGSRMFVDPAKPATVEELLQGMIIQSGNDASIILAEAVAGSEGSFAELMNKEAARLGMKNTQYRNSTGLPNAQHYGTANDLAILARRLITDHPTFYALYSNKEYTYNNIKQPNRNRLLFIDPSVDGLKTGHTDAAGYCLIASSKREQPNGGQSRRLLTVVLGAASESSRAIESQKLLNYGFQNFDAVKLYGKGQAVGTYEVWKGKAAELKAGFDQDVMITVAKGQSDKVKADIERLQPLIAPIAAGQKIGTLRVKLDDKVLLERPLLAQNAIEEAGIFGRLYDSVRLMLKR